MSSAESKPAIGFVGLGLMGYGMATNLVKKGYKVRGYDISAAVLSRFESEGGIAAMTLPESTKDCSFYVCMVASAPQVQGVVFDSDEALVKSLPKDAVFLLCSTVPSSYAKSVEAQFQQYGRRDIQLVDSPVSGGAGRAAAGTLTIMAGGSDAALARAKPLLDALADPAKLFLCGGVGGGSSMKMAHQVLAGIQILAASEAMGFAAKLGADAAEARDAVLRSDAWSWMFENRVPRMLERDYQPGASALAIILKDVAIITRSAQETHFPTPLVSVAEQVYLSALPLGFERDDDAGMVRAYYPHPLGEWSPLTADKGANKEADDGADAIALTVTLLCAVHLWAAAEAVAFAKHLGIDLGQFYELCKDAAGGSVMFRDVAPEMMKLLGAKGSEGSGQRKEQSLREVLEGLDEVVLRASKAQAPLHLGSAARNLMMLAMKRLGPDARDYDLVRFWEDI